MDRLFFSSENIWVARRTTSPNIWITDRNFNRNEDPPSPRWFLGSVGPSFTHRRHDLGELGVEHVKLLSFGGARDQGASIGGECAAPYPLNWSACRGDVVNGSPGPQGTGRRRAARRRTRPRSARPWNTRTGPRGSGQGLCRADAAPYKEFQLWCRLAPKTVPGSQRIVPASKVPPAWASRRRRPRPTSTAAFPGHSIPRQPRSRRATQAVPEWLSETRGRDRSTPPVHQEVFSMVASVTDRDFPSLGDGVRRVPCPARRRGDVGDESTPGTRPRRAVRAAMLANDRLTLGRGRSVERPDGSGPARATTRCRRRFS